MKKGLEVCGGASTGVWGSAGSWSCDTIRQSNKSGNQEIRQSEQSDNQTNLHICILEESDNQTIQKTSKSE